jgi:hypothetical protein
MLTIPNRETPIFKIVESLGRKINIIHYQNTALCNETTNITNIINMLQKEDKIENILLIDKNYLFSCEIPYTLTNYNILSEKYTNLVKSIDASNYIVPLIKHKNAELIHPDIIFDREEIYHYYDYIRSLYFTNIDSYVEYVLNVENLYKKIKCNYANLKHINTLSDVTTDLIPIILNKIDNLNLFHIGKLHTIQEENYKIQFQKKCAMPWK